MRLIEAQARPGRHWKMAVSAVIVAIAAGLVLPASAASANGTGSKTCAYGVSANGSSNRSYAATSTPGTVCGSAKARALYQTYSGSPVYYSSWVSSAGTAIANPGNTVVGGNHHLTDPAPAYIGNFPFST
jgi:hypothetical protein